MAVNAIAPKFQATVFALCRRALVAALFSFWSVAYAAAPPTTLDILTAGGRFLFDGHIDGNALEGLTAQCDQQPTRDKADTTDACIAKRLRAQEKEGGRVERVGDGLRWTRLRLKADGSEEVVLQGPMDVLDASGPRLFLSPNGPFVGSEVPDALKMAQNSPPDAPPMGSAAAPAESRNPYGVAVNLVDTQTVELVDGARSGRYRRMDPSGPRLPKLVVIGMHPTGRCVEAFNRWRGAGTLDPIWRPVGRRGLALQLGTAAWHVLPDSYGAGRTRSLAPHTAERHALSRRAGR